jgi:hypothetical protein
MKRLVTILSIFIFCICFGTKPCTKCDLEKVRIVGENINKLTYNILSDFLCTVDTSCINNAEFSEASNGTLFSVLEKYPDLFFQVVSKGNVNITFILKEIESPVDDLIDLQGIYDKIKLVPDNTELKTKCLNSLIIAAEKGGLKLKK